MKRIIVIFGGQYVSIAYTDEAIDKLKRVMDEYFVHGTYSIQYGMNGEDRPLWGFRTDKIEGFYVVEGMSIQEQTLEYIKKQNEAGEGWKGDE